MHGILFPVQSTAPYHTKAFQFVDANCGVVSRISTGQADDQPQPNQLRHNQPRAAKATTRTEIGVFLTPHGWIRIERLRCVTAETSRFPVPIR